MRDRLVQRKIAEVLIDGDGDKIRTSYGFGALKKQGADAERSATDVALSLRQGAPWVVKSDISAFFDRLPREHVKSAYRSVCKKRTLYALIDQIIEVEAVPQKGTPYKIYESGIERGLGLRQGMPLSPLLAHISLIKLDQFLEKRGIKFVRYVDDLIFFGNNKIEAISAFEDAQNWLSNIKLELPLMSEGKTELCNPSKHVEFLGIDIYNSSSGYRLRIPNSKFSALDSRFMERTSLNFDNPERGEIASALRFISSARKSYAGVYRNLDNWSAFEKKIKDYERRSIRSLSRKFCETTQNKGGLSPKVLWAFGLTP